MIPFSFIKNSIIYDVDAVALFTRAAAAGITIPYAEKTYINNVITALKSTLSRNGSTYLWAETDLLWLNGISKAFSLMNIRQNAYNGTIVNDYPGSWAEGVGFTGNAAGSFHILTGYNPGAGGTVYTQNSASLGFLNLSTALTTGYSFGVTNFASTAGTILTAGRTNGIPFADVNVGSFSASASGAVNMSYNRGWTSIKRTGASAQTRMVDASPIASDTHASAAIPNFEFSLFARNKGATIQDFSNNSAAYPYAGSKDIDDLKIQKIIEELWIKPRAKSDWMSCRLLTLGDSMTAQGANGNYGRWTKTALEALGNTWQGHCDGLANGTISQVNTIAINNTDGFIKPYLSRSILAFMAGTNDLANSSAVTGTTIYNRYASFVASRVAAGHTKMILMGMMDRKATFSGGQTQGGFNAGQASFNSLMRADFTVSTAVTNVYTSTLPQWNGCCYVDIIADTKFQNAADTGYFMPDFIHPNTTLDDWLANTYIVPLINANIV